MNQARDLTLYEAAQQLRSNELSSEEIVRSCLQRIDEHEPDVKAWVQVYAEQAISEAKVCDAKAKTGHWRGTLHGLPIGIKDIYAVQNMMTRAGTDAYDATIAQQDAVSVHRLRQAGAIFLGKTETTAFAMGDPAPTHNPWHLQHTPAGSSSGSGAAVADRMCLAALGTQTVGSVIRPAAYNGVVGFKPSYGSIPIDGVIPLSWQFDHVGSLSRSVADACLLWQIMSGQPSVAAINAQQPRRLWRCRGFFEAAADPEMLAALEDVCRQLQEQGVEIIERELPFDKQQMIDSHYQIMSSEAATYHKPNFALQPQLFPPRIRELINQGFAVSATDYLIAQHYRKQLTVTMTTALADVDAAIMPAATGPAPRDLSHTGDRLFSILSSFCGMPALSIPVSLSSAGLPLSIQFLAPAQQDQALCSLAAWCENLIPFPYQPKLLTD